jgi:hypothetical protein
MKKYTCKILVISLLFFIFAENTISAAAPSNEQSEECKEFVNNYLELFKNNFIVKMSDSTNQALPPKEMFEKIKKELFFEYESKCFELIDLNDQNKPIVLFKNMNLISSEIVNPKVEKFVQALFLKAQEDTQFLKEFIDTEKPTLFSQAQLIVPDEFKKNYPVYATISAAALIPLMPLDMPVTRCLLSFGQNLCSPFVELSPWGKEKKTVKSTWTNLGSASGISLLLYGSGKILPICDPLLRRSIAIASSAVDITFNTTLFLGKTIASVPLATLAYQGYLPDILQKNKNVKLDKTDKNNESFLGQVFKVGAALYFARCAQLTAESFSHWRERRLFFKEMKKVGTLPTECVVGNAYEEWRKNHLAEQNSKQLNIVLQGQAELKQNLAELKEGQADQTAAFKALEVTVVQGQADLKEGQAEQKTEIQALKVTVAQGQKSNTTQFEAMQRAIDDLSKGIMRNKKQLQEDFSKQLAKLQKSLETAAFEQKKEIIAEIAALRAKQEQQLQAVSNQANYKLNNLDGQMRKIDQNAQNRHEDLLGLLSQKNLPNYEVDVQVVTVFPEDDSSRGGEMPYDSEFAKKLLALTNQSGSSK